MTEDGSNEVNAAIYAALCLMEEGEIAKAVVFLYTIRQRSHRLWLTIKELLLKHAQSHGKLLCVATIVEAAGKDTLGESFHLVPGLQSAYARYENERNNPQA